MVTTWGVLTCGCAPSCGVDSMRTMSGGRAAADSAEEGGAASAEDEEEMPPPRVSAAGVPSLAPPCPSDADDGSGPTTGVTGGRTTRDIIAPMLTDGNIVSTAAAVTTTGEEAAEAGRAPDDEDADADDDWVGAGTAGDDEECTDACGVKSILGGACFTSDGALCCSGDAGSDGARIGLAGWRNSSSRSMS